mmetsp:Transcript_1650/g.4085  ORF Transcript_1650/g.4085 Transcript_1650/m.4085 type:complete len:223 (+) Transcript_1650:2553-3221(+)
MGIMLMRVASGRLGSAMPAGTHASLPMVMLGTRPCRIAARCCSLRLRCSAASIHLTTMGDSMPSHTNLLSRWSMAFTASSCMPMVTRPQPLVVGAPWKARKRFTSYTLPKPENSILTSSSVADRSTLAKKSIRLSALDSSTAFFFFACSSGSAHLTCMVPSGSPSMVSIALSACSRVCIVTKPLPLLLLVLRSRKRLISSTTPNWEKKVTISSSASCVGALE